MRTARRRQQHDHRLIAAGNRFYAPAPLPDYVPPAETPRPAWLRLGGGFVVKGTTGPVLQIVGVRPAQGGWEVLGHLSARRWYAAGEVEAV